VTSHMSNKDEKVLETALTNLMGSKKSDSGPTNLKKTLVKSASFLFDLADSGTYAAQIINDIIDGGPDNHLRNLLGQYLTKWDSIVEPDWTPTQINTSERRRSIYGLLGISENLIENLDRSFPFYLPDNTVFVISEDYDKWYFSDRKENRFYWEKYSDNLSESGWPRVSVKQLDDATDEIIDRLDDPTKARGSSKRGLVVGYVQSGKTANFTGLIAKAIDAGYKIIIVLAGTLNVLRSQTQRRIDKELIGKENLMASLQSLTRPADYENDVDWMSFVEYGTEPTPMIERITDSVNDHTSGYGKQLVPVRAKPAQSARDNANRNSPVKIIVAKKQGQVLQRLIKDFKNVKNDIHEHPVLVIDDESDQASVNVAAEDKKRSSINKKLIELLDIFVAAQYVGYTATPAANVFVDSENSNDLFPRDFVLTLPRPLGYMGVRDLYDFDENWNDVPDEEETNRMAYVREIDGEDQNANNLPKAINSFILTGAIKLFRKEQASNVSIKHHTMLVHTTVRISEHNDFSKKIGILFNHVIANEDRMLESLKSLYEGDFLKTSQEILHISSEISMCSFNDLIPFIFESVERIKVQPVRIVNGDKQNQVQMPNFDETKVWSILVGGAKLSRGYTVEGLTISYYRRVAGQSDTLMQTARWFGFRRGYQDVVRLFIGVKEKKGKTKIVDLYEDFKGSCRDEEMFRVELQKYHLKGDGTPVRPIDIQPLFPVNLLPPTAKNKMRHVTIVTKNLSGNWKESAAHVSQNTEIKLGNMKSLRKLLASSKQLGEVSFTLDDTKENAIIYKSISNVDMAQFLEGYRWSQERIIEDELNFILSKLMDNNIKQWTVMFPQLVNTREHVILGDSEVSIHRRGLNGKGNFKVFSDKKHRKIAKWLSGIDNDGTLIRSEKEIRSTSTATLVVYPVVPKTEVYQENEIESTPCIGFGIQFPYNNVSAQLFYSR
jgi:hypothetical protein